METAEKSASPEERVKARQVARAKRANALTQSVGDFCDHYGFVRSVIYGKIRLRQIPVIRTGLKNRGIRLDPAAVLAAMSESAKPVGTTESTLQ